MLPAGGTAAPSSLGLTPSGCVPCGLGLLMNSHPHVNQGLEASAVVQGVRAARSTGGEGASPAVGASHVMVGEMQPLCTQRRCSICIIAGCADIGVCSQMIVHIIGKVGVAPSAAPSPPLMAS